MKNKNLLELLDKIKIDDSPQDEDKGERILIIDGLNLFFRNFAVLNYINHNGTHIGGLGGFLRSLGSLVKQFHPTSIYVVFDGSGSTINRKNLLPEYKSGRSLSRVNKVSFDSLELENESKSDQIGRLIHYLRCLPIKIIALDKVEADDIISHLSTTLSKNDSNKCFIVSSDQDFIQLVDDNITVYRPIEKEHYTPKLVKEKYDIDPNNFIIRKTLLGDNSDKIQGIKGLGDKKLLKFFPELKERKISLEDIYDICEKKHKEHIIYSRIIFDFDKVQNNYKVMNLGNPMLDEQEKDFIFNLIKAKPFKLDIVEFVKLYNEDGMGNVIKNIEYWLRDNWEQLNRYNKTK